MTSLSPEFGTTSGSESCLCRATVEPITIKFGTAEARRLNWALVLCEVPYNNVLYCNAVSERLNWALVLCEVPYNNVLYCNAVCIRHKVPAKFVEKLFLLARTLCSNLLSSFETHTRKFVVMLFKFAHHSVMQSNSPLG